LKIRRYRASFPRVRAVQVVLSVWPWLRFTGFNHACNVSYVVKTDFDFPPLEDSRTPTALRHDYTFGSSRGSFDNNRMAAPDVRHLLRLLAPTSCSMVQECSRSWGTVKPPSPRWLDQLSLILLVYVVGCSSSAFSK
jgi:hypothetical protein